MNKVIEYNITDASLAKLAERHKDVDAYKDLDTAKAAQKECQQLRKKLDERKKVLKKDALDYTRKVDSEFNRILAAIKDVEDPIKTQLDEIRNAEKRKEEERLAKIQSALDEIETLAEGRHDLTAQQLTERVAKLDAITVTEDVFQDRTDDANALYEQTASKLRITLTKATEREEQERRIAEETAELDRRKAEFEEEQRVAREKEDARKAEERAAEDKRLQKEREELAAREQAQREKDEAEAREKAKRDAEDRRLRLAPDHEKLETLATQLEEFPLPQLESDEANAVVEAFVGDMKLAIKKLRLAAEALK